MAKYDYWWYCPIKKIVIVIFSMTGEENLIFVSPLRLRRLWTPVRPSMTWIVPRNAPILPRVWCSGELNKRYKLFDGLKPSHLPTWNGPCDASGRSWKFWVLQSLHCLDIKFAAAQSCAFRYYQLNRTCLLGSECVLNHQTVDILPIRVYHMLPFGRW